MTAYAEIPRIKRYVLEDARKSNFAEGGKNNIHRQIYIYIYV
jgi:hypothetical protein